ncbi:hypothetical protein ACFL6G_04140 [candidate division KSB1 bacterium]
MFNKLIITISGLILLTHLNCIPDLGGSVLEPAGNGKKDKPEILWPIDYRFPDIEYPATKNSYVALTATFTNPDDEHRSISKIVLVDFYNNDDYRIVDREKLSAEKPCFSKDKSAIIFGNPWSVAYDAGYAITYYNIEKDSLFVFPSKYHSVWGHNPVWNYDETGFYYYNQAWGAIVLCQYDIRTTEYENYRYADYLLGTKGQDSLIVQSRYNSQRIIHYSAANGIYLSWIDNPRFQTYDNGVIPKDVHSIKYHHPRGLFLYIDDEEDYLCVTNLKGNFQRKYVQVDRMYSVVNPIWGPEGRYILYTQYSYYTLSNGRVMVLDCRTGEVRELVSPDKIDGAISLKDPGY